MTTKTTNETMAETLARVTAERDALLAAAQFALDTISSISTEQFAKGEDREAREKLDAAITLTKVGAA